MKILFMVGSLRKESLNRKLAENLAEIAKNSGAEIAFADLDLPIFNADNYQNCDPKIEKLREEIAAADGIFIVSPEYNRAISAVAKNALDWTGWMVENSWNGKKVALAGVSTGQNGSAFAQYDLRKILTFVGAKVMNQPEFMLSFAEKKFDENGRLIREKAGFAEDFVENFAKFVDEN